MFFRCMFLSLRNLGKHRLRSFLCILSVAISVFAVIGVINVSELGKTAVNTELEKTGLGGLLIHCGTDGTVKNEMLSVIQSTRGVREAGGVIMDKTEYKTSQSDKFSEETVLWAVDNDTEKLISLEAVQGRYFTVGDIVQKKAVCMVDENIAQELMTYGDAVGRVVTLKVGNEQHDFEIVGIVAAGGGILQNFTAFLPSMVFIPQSTYTAITGKNDYTQIAVRLDPTADSDVVKLQLTRKLSGYDSIEIENLAKQKDSLNEVVNIITLIITAVGAISVLVAGFGIMTMMLMSVGERTREIGIKKALGARCSHIVGEFLWEAVIIMMIGFIFGCGGALGGVWLAATKYGLEFAVPTGSIILCLICTVGLGIVFGGYPAHKAAKLTPAAALSSE